MRVAASGGTAHLDQTTRVRGVGRPDYQQCINLARNGFDRRLTVGRGIADIFLVRADDRREPGLQRGDNLDRIIDRQRRLGDEGQLFGVARGYMRHVGHGFHQQHLALRQLPHGANGLRMAGMADHDHLQPVFVVPLGLDMHLAHQRAGCIDEDHLPRLCRSRNRLGHAMGRKDHRTVIGHFVQFLDKDRTLRLERVDHKLVVHDLVAHIDRRAPFRQRHFDDLDRPVHTSAKAAWRCKIEMQRGELGHGRCLVRVASEVGVRAGQVQPKDRTPAVAAASAA